MPDPDHMQPPDEQPDGLDRQSSSDKEKKPDHSSDSSTPETLRFVPKKQSFRDFIMESAEDDDNQQPERETSESPDSEITPSAGHDETENKRSLDNLPEPASESDTGLDEFSPDDVPPEPDTSVTEPAERDNAPDVLTPSEQPDSDSPPDVIEYVTDAEVESSTESGPETGATEPSDESEQEDDPDSLTLFSHEFDPLAGELISGEEEPSEVSGESEGDESGEESTSREPSELDELNNQLAVEFRDTLTGFNAYTLPVGLLLIVLAVTGWLAGPIFSTLGENGILADDTTVFTILTSPVTASDLIYVISTILLVAGIHFIAYWTFHKISNTVKTRELDRLLESRRVSNPCTHLDVVEGDKAETDDTDVEGSDDETDIVTGEMSFSCSLYDVDLEESALCAVCEKYKPSRDISDGDLFPESED